MPTVTFQAKSFECSPDESLLDCLNRQGANISYGCRGGFCQACMLKAVHGTPPVEAQAGIKPSLKEKGYFLSCLCKPVADLQVELPDRRDEFISATVTAKEYLGSSVIRLLTSRPQGFSYRSGQFVNFIRAEDGLSRSYSLASIPEDDVLEFHIRLIPEGRMSNWVANSVNLGDSILISDPLGDCCYRKHYAERPLLLAGTGTGLAPLLGVLRDALSQGHRGRIRLLHGGLREDALYYADQLRALEARHAQFTYIPCVLNGPISGEGIVGPIDEQLSSQLALDSDWTAFLCGDSSIVASMRRACASAGLDESAIHSDAFG